VLGLQRRGHEANLSPSAAIMPKCCGGQARNRGRPGGRKKAEVPLASILPHLKFSELLFI